MISITNPELFQISPRAICFLDPFKVGKPSGLYYLSATAAHPYSPGYTFHDHDLKLFALQRYGDSSHLYFSTKPTPSVVRFPLSIFNGLYRLVNGSYVPYDPTFEFGKHDIFNDNRVYIKKPLIGFVDSGLEVRRTSCCFATDISLNNTPGGTGVIYALDKSPTEIKTLIDSLPARDPYRR